VPEALFVSAKTREGLGSLEKRLEELAAEGAGAVDLLVPHDRYDVIARMHTLGQIHSQEHRDDGVLIHGRFPPTQAGFFEPFVVVV
jgi:GTP-binding protein HflX